MKKFLLVVTLLAATFQLTFAQDRSVSGKITDEAGAGMPGANVAVKGTAKGTITNADGQFTIVASPENVLTISAIGYATQEITIGTQTSINTQMVIDVTQLSEVVVVGYGDQARSMVSSGISTVKTENIKDMPTTSFDQKLQGQLAGVQINQSSGAPGGATVIRIRGAGSLSTQNGANDPLFVIDGFPVSNTFNQSQNPLSTINPNDIESITVLKDAASTSIYGSRGSNGVILVNTKRAKAGQSSIDVSAYTGLQTWPDSRRLPMMNGQEYAQFRYEAAQDEAARQGLTFDTRMLHPSYRDPAAVGEGTDWYKEVIQTAPQSDVTVTVTKGTNNVRSLVSLGYFNQQGIVKTTGIERYSLRANIDADVVKNVKVGVNLSPTFTVRQGPNSEGTGFGIEGVTSNARLASPVEPVYKPDGTLNYIINPWRNNFTPGGATGYLGANPSYPQNGIAVANVKSILESVTYKTFNARILANTYLTWEIVPGLTAKTTFNADIRYDKTNTFNPSWTNRTWNGTTPLTYPNAFNNGTAVNTQTYNFLNENTINYNKNWSKHSLSLLGGFTVQKERSEQLYISGSQYSSDALWTINNATVLSASTNPANNDINEWRLVSYLARANYSFDDKYIVSGTVRTDGSSRFGSNNRYGVFPSASAAWVVSNESFFPENNILDEVKVRGSYGISGNNSIGNYSFTPNVIATQYVFNNAVAPGASLNGLPNPDLSWEESKQLDIGLDLNFFKGRISLISEFYNRLTSNMLQTPLVPWVSGFASVSANAGTIRNRGVEFSLSTKNTIDKVKWSTDFNISMNRNMVLDLGGTTPAFSGANILAAGQPLGYFWAVQNNGFVTAADIADPTVAKVVGTTFVGAIKYKDISAATDVPGTTSGPDGIITQTDRVAWASPYPKFTLGMTNRVSYMNFDLAVVIQASYGNHIYANYKNNTTNLDGSFNVEKDVAVRWRPNEDNSGKFYPTTNGNTAFFRDGWINSAWIYDASYLNIKNITLGYNFNLKSNSARVYFSSQNAFIFTKYPGGNPEVSTTGNSARQPSVDNNGYPLAATFIMGVNLKF